MNPDLASGFSANAGAVSLVLLAAEAVSSIASTRISPKHRETRRVELCSKGLAAKSIEPIGDLTQYEAEVPDLAVVLGVLFLGEDPLGHRPRSG